MVKKHTYRGLVLQNFPGGGKGSFLGPSPSPLGVFHTSKPLPGRGVLPLVMPRVILRLKAALLLVIPDRTGNVCTAFWLECRAPAYRILLLLPFTLNCVRSLSNLLSNSVYLSSAQAIAKASQL